MGNCSNFEGIDVIIAGYKKLPKYFALSRRIVIVLPIHLTSNIFTEKPGIFILNNNKPHVSYVFPDTSILNYVILIPIELIKGYNETKIIFKKEDNSINMNKNTLYIICPNIKYIHTFNKSSRFINRISDYSSTS